MARMKDEDRDSTLTNEEADRLVEACVNNPVPRVSGGLDHTGVPVSASTEVDVLDHETSQLQEHIASAQRVPIEQVLKEVGMDRSVLANDPRHKTRFSTVPVVPSPVAMPESALFEAQAAAAAVSVLDNPDAAMYAKGGPHNQLSNDEFEHVSKISKALDHRPSPDVKAYAGNKVVTLSGSVRDIPNKLTFERATRLLEALFEDEDTVHLVVKAAQHAGQNDKPALWLSQQVALELSYTKAWEQVSAEIDPSAPPYREKEDGSQSPIWSALREFFDEDTCEKLDNTARITNRGVLQVLKLICTRVSKRRIAISTGVESHKSKYAV